MNQNPPEKIRLADIIDENRQRKDYGNIEEFGQQLKTEGLIHPIILVVDNNSRYRLIAGGRRRAALLSAGFEFVYHGVTCDPKRPGYLLASELTPAKQEELELMENIRRADMTWQEQCIGIARIHRLKVREGALNAERWGQRETARLLGYNSHCVIGYALKVAAELEKSPDNRFWKYDSLKAAWDQLMLEEIQDLESRLAATSAVSKVSDVVDPFADANIVSEAADAKSIARERYLSNPHNDPDAFEEYYEQHLKLKETIREHQLTIPLSKRFFLGDSITFMNHNPGRYDHIITDIPYGIDVEMMDQCTNAIKDVETIKAEHDVEYNLDLIKAFFPAAFRAVKDNAFVITWCDQMLWQYMYDLATAAGFKVQRWPFTWVKTYRCANGAAQFNFTKATEIAMICRKGQPTLVNPGPNNYVLCGKTEDDICDIVRHPFAKPLAAWRPLIEAVSWENQEILEPFAGGGSGVLSLLRLRRNVTAVELNEKHFNELLENVKRHYLSINPSFKFS